MAIEPVATARPERRLARSALNTLVPVVALAAVVWWATRQEAPTLPRSPEAFAWLGLALAVYGATTLVRGERWHQIVARSGLRAPRGETYRLTTVGYMGNNVLPARSGDLLRAFLLAPLARTPRRHVLGTVVAERLLDAAALAAVFVAVAYGVLHMHAPEGTLAAVAVGVAAVLAAAALAVVLVRRRGAFIPLREAIRPLTTPTRALASLHGAALLGVSILVWILEGAVYLMVANAAGLELGLLGALYAVALTNLFALVPAAPGYVGTFDAAVLFSVRSLGESGSDALVYLVLLRFVLFVPITLVGIAFLLARYGGWARLRAAREDEG